MMKSRGMASKWTIHRKLLKRSGSAREMTGYLAGGLWKLVVPEQAGHCAYKYGAGSIESMYANRAEWESPTSH